LSEEKWKEVLYKEPLEVDKEKVHQLLFKKPWDQHTEEDKSFLAQSYDVAARKAARIYFEVAQGNCMVGSVLGAIKRLSDRMSSNNWVYKPLKEDQRHQIWQDAFFDLLSFLEYVMEKEASERNKEIDAVGLSSFQGGWAVQAAVKALEEEGYLDEFGWPTVGHLVEEGTCPRCHIPIQENWRKKK
jgi:hypothetical protein